MAFAVPAKMCGLKAKETGMGGGHSPNCKGGTLNVSLSFLVSYVGERPWWPIQSPNKGRKKKAKS